MRDEKRADQILWKRLALFVAVLAVLLLPTASWLSGGAAYRLWVDLTYGEHEPPGYEVVIGYGETITRTPIGEPYRTKLLRWLPGPKVLREVDRRDRPKLAQPR